MAAKILDALAQADAALGLDRVLGEAEARRDLALGQAVDLPQGEDLAAAGHDVVTRADRQRPEDAVWLIAPETGDEPPLQTAATAGCVN